MASRLFIGACAVWPRALARRCNCFAFDFRLKLLASTYWEFWGAFAHRSCSHGLLAPAVTCIILIGSLQQKIRDEFFK